MTCERVLGATLALVLTAAGTAHAAGPDQGIVAAARQNDPALVRQQIRHGADVNARTVDGSTALLWAAYHDDVSLVNELLASGASPDIPNVYEETPISIAV